MVIIELEELERIRKPWRNSLIIRLQGKNLLFNGLTEKLKRLWKQQADLQIPYQNGFHPHTPPQTATPWRRRTSPPFRDLNLRQHPQQIQPRDQLCTSTGEPHLLRAREKRRRSHSSPL